MRIRWKHARDDGRGQEQPQVTRLIVPSNKPPQEPPVAPQTIRIEFDVVALTEALKKKSD